MEVSRSDVNRLFLQAILSRGVISAAVAKMLMHKCYQAVKTANPQIALEQPSWDHFITRLNASVTKLDFALRPIHDEETGEEFWVWTNLKGDEIAQVATEFTANEITFFRAVIEQIMLGPGNCFCVGSSQALREIAENNITSFNKSQGEELLDTFIAKGWLNQSKKGRYTLAKRSLVELLPYLKSTYGERVLTCDQCSEPLTRGVACNNADCNCRVHYYCYSKWSKAKPNGLSCPKCRIAWPNHDPLQQLKPIGEEAAPPDHQRSRRTRARSEVSDEEEDAEFSFDEDAQEVAPKRARVKEEKTSKGKGKKAARIESDEDDDVEMDDSTAPAQPMRRSTRHR